jgi:signal transduction histidine kinase
MTQPKKAQPERENTDQSLRTERAKTDRALAESQEVIEKDADRVIRRARDKADAVMLAARDKADQRQAGGALEAAAPAGPAAVAKERALEDRTLQKERASADEILQEERAESARVLSRLLPLEREQTDRTLLTERVRSDDALSDRDNFLSIVSHDLRNLLGGIALSAQLLSARAPRSEEGAQILAETQRIERYVARMHRLVGDLLDVGSIDAGKLAIQPERSDLVSLLAEAAELFQPLTAAKGISLAIQPIGRPLLADFDHERMLQVLANLVSNSIKVTPEGGSIQLGGEQAADELRVWVRDTGSGIPDDMLDFVFERFWQVRKNDRRGLGLGLYISRCIVEAHGGRIGAQSQLGEGSHFWFTLPAAGVPREPASS